MTECSNEVRQLFIDKINESFGKVVGVYDDILRDSCWVKIESEHLPEVQEGCAIPLGEFLFHADGTVEFQFLLLECRVFPLHGESKLQG